MNEINLTVTPYGHYLIKNSLNKELLNTPDLSLALKFLRKLKKPYYNINGKLLKELEDLILDSQA